MPRQALAGEEITQEAALDWICLHVDPAHLPRRFAGSARSHAAAAGVRVLAKAEKRARARQASVFLCETGLLTGCALACCAICQPAVTCRPISNLLAVTRHQ